MKWIPLFALLAAFPALAQDAPDKAAEKPAAPAKPAEPAKPADEAPAKEAPSASKPDLTPAKPEPRPAASNLKPADLPPLPARTEENDLSKGQPGGKLKPTGETNSELMPNAVPNVFKPAPGTTGDRPKTRTALRAPVTASDLDLRIRYREAETKASADPGVQAAWQESREALTEYDRREAMKNYYNLLYKKILAIDKTVAPLVTDRQQYNIRRLTQSRIDPTDPIEDARYSRDQ